MSLSKSYHFKDKVDFPAQGVLITQQVTHPTRSVSVKPSERSQAANMMEGDIQFYIKHLNLVIK